MDKKTNPRSNESNFTFNLEKFLPQFSKIDYKEDYIITNNILKFRMKDPEVYNYEKNKIYDHKELDAFKDKFITPYNAHYFPHELHLNSYKNIYDEKHLPTLSEKSKKSLNPMGDGQEREKEHDTEKEQEKENENENEREREKEEISEEEIRFDDDDYNYDYNQSEDELENDGPDENVI